MTVRLFHYVHCPYCVRVRLALGYLGTPWESQVVSYDDEVTPVKLSGKKMLPIAVIDDVPMNESLDIIRRLDPAGALAPNIDATVDTFLVRAGELVHSLAMPYWAWTPEFTPAARAYFQQKKEVKRGPFANLVKRRAEFEAPLLELLRAHEKSLQPFWSSETLALADIAVAAHLWGLFVVPEFRFPEAWHRYLMDVKRLCAFDYHSDFWSTP